MARITLRAAFHRVVRVWNDRVQAGTLRPQSAESYISTIERLIRFAAALDLNRLDDITDQVGQTFIDAPGHNRQGQLVTIPADSTRRLRKTAVDALFAEARQLGLTTKAPLLDLPSIPRSACRPAGVLTDQDIDVLRFHSERGMPQTRHATVLGLLLSGLHTSEIGYTSPTDLDLGHTRVWACGAARITARYCSLDDEWTRNVLRLRGGFVRDRTGQDGLHALATTADAPAYRRQASVCAAFGEIVRASGTRPGGRSATPRDVTSWLAAKTLDGSGQIADVALRLGLSSLDGAARLADYQWRTPTTSGDA